MKYSNVCAILISIYKSSLFFYNLGILILALDKAGNSVSAEYREKMDTITTFWKSPENKRKRMV